MVTMQESHTRAREHRHQHPRPRQLHSQRDGATMPSGAVVEQGPRDRVGREPRAILPHPPQLRDAQGRHRQNFIRQIQHLQLRLHPRETHSAFITIRIF